jgi:hypothetical protein
MWQSAPGGESRSNDATRELIPAYAHGIVILSYVHRHRRFQWKRLSMIFMNELTIHGQDVLSLPFHLGPRMRLEPPNWS